MNQGGDMPDSNIDAKNSNMSSNIVDEVTEKVTRLMVFAIATIATICFLIDHFHKWDTVHAILKL